MFSKRLKELRIEKELSQSELARDLKLSNRTISMYEHGNSEPSIKTLINIAHYFNVTTDYLVGLSDIKRTDINRLYIAKYLGLTEKSIEQLHLFRELSVKANDSEYEYYETARHSALALDTINLLLDSGYELLSNITYYLHFSATHFKSVYNDSPYAFAPISELELWDEFSDISYSDDWDLWSNALLVLINNELTNHRHRIHSEYRAKKKD